MKRVFRMLFLLIFSSYFAVNCGTVGEEWNLVFHNLSGLCGVDIDPDLSAIPIALDSTLTIEVQKNSAGFSNDFEEENENSDVKIKEIKSLNGLFEVISSGNPFVIKATKEGEDKIIVIDESGIEDRISIKIKKAAGMTFMYYMDDAIPMVLAENNKMIVEKEVTYVSAAVCFISNEKEIMLGEPLFENFKEDPSGIFKLVKRDDSLKLNINPIQEGEARIEYSYGDYVFSSGDIKVGSNEEVSSMIINNDKEGKFTLAQSVEKARFYPIFLNKNGDYVIKKPVLAMEIEVENPSVVEASYDFNVYSPFFTLRGLKPGVTKVTVTWFGVSQTITIQVQ